MRALFAIALLATAGCATLPHPRDDRPATNSDREPSELSAHIAALNEQRNASTDPVEQARIQRELRPLLAEAEAHARASEVVDEGSGGGFPTLPPLQLMYLGQAEAPDGLAGTFFSTAPAGKTAYGMNDGAYICISGPCSSTTGFRILSESGTLSFYANSTRYLLVNPGSSVTTQDSLTVGPSAGSTIRATGYGVGNNASNSIGIGIGATSIDYRTISATATHNFQNKDGAATYATIGPNTVGQVSLVAGSATPTVTSGTKCTCVDTTAVAAVKCNVAGTTLTITGTGTDSIVYHCF